MLEDLVREARVFLAVDSRWPNGAGEHRGWRGAVVVQDEFFGVRLVSSSDLVHVRGEKEDWLTFVSE